MTRPSRSRRDGYDDIGRNGIAAGLQQEANMQERHALYAVIGEFQDRLGTITNLELRTNLNPVMTHRFKRNSAGELVLEIPEPIIRVASSTKQDVIYELAERLFGTPRDPNHWRYIGDHIRAYTLQQGG